MLDGIENGQSLQAGDFNFDGYADLFLAEMRLNGSNPKSKLLLLFGDGKGDFRHENIAAGFDNHESKIADLDGDGTFDVLGRPYNHEVPALNVWLNPAGPKPRR
ncbi:MAG: FG-GAP repeat domain-containing protein [Bryobacteraceae bacterium]